MKPLNRPLFAEVLEGRRLLSGAVGDIYRQSVAAIEVIEFELADDEDSDRALLPDGLPGAVASAIANRFPDFLVIGAEHGIDDGTVEYGVIAIGEGKQIELTLSEAGEVLHQEEFLAASDLPAPLLGWLSETYPGASIDEASIVTKDGVVSYDLSFATPEGEAFDATLRLPPGSSDEPTPTRVNALPSLNQSADRGSEAVRPSPIADDRAGGSRDLRAAGAPAGRAATESELTSELITATAAIAQTTAPATDDIQDPRQAAALMGLNVQLAELLMAATAAVAALDTARQLSEVLPIDLAAVERRLNHLLGELDFMASELAASALASAQLAPGSLIGLGLLATLAGCAKLASRRSRGERRGQATLSFDAASSTWGWLPDSAFASTRRSRWSLALAEDRA